MSVYGQCGFDLLVQVSLEVPQYLLCNCVYAGRKYGFLNYNQGFLRCFRDPIRIPRIEIRVPKIGEIGSIPVT